MKKIITPILISAMVALIAFGDKGSNKEIVITGNDTMQFDIKNFEVDAGSEVKLTLKNIGKVPKIAMGHNLVVLKKGISAIAFGQKALGAGANATNPLHLTHAFESNAGHGSKHSETATCSRSSTSWPRVWR